MTLGTSSTWYAVFPGSMPNLRSNRYVQTQKLVRDAVIKHVSYFTISATAKELDKKFASIIDMTPLETEDQLSVSFDWDGAFGRAHDLDVSLTRVYRCQNPVRSPSRGRDLGHARQLLA